MFELLEIEAALDAATLERIRGEMRAADGVPARVTGAGADSGPAAAPSVRRATRVAVSDSSRAAVRRMLEEQRPRMETRFGRPLNSCEEPQFLRYGPGDHFVAHQDGNTPLIRDDSRFRKVSVVIFLSEQSEHPAPYVYCGGSLVLHGPFPSEKRMSLAPAAGTLVAFPSETTHEVAPIIHGERLSIVSWYRAEAGASAA
ncbi:MAG: 2OG-Fe(II) oxygenase [Thermoleophilaceae bacterium]